MSRQAIGRHAAHESLPRHRHGAGYVALVLGGSYVEAGEAGRIWARSGQAIVHHAWSAHQDRFGMRGAEVLNLPLPFGLPEGPGTVADPDMIARIAERDPFEAAQALVEQFLPEPCEGRDWPELLAQSLREETSFLSITTWAETYELNPASVSRGFSKAYGVSPKRYRLESRTRAALTALPGWRGSLAALAAEYGFADQPHFTRSVVALTGAPPVRHRANSIQAGQVSSG